MRNTTQDQMQFIHGIPKAFKQWCIKHINCMDITFLSPYMVIQTTRVMASLQFVQEQFLYILYFKNLQIL